MGWQKVPNLPKPPHQQLQQNCLQLGKRGASTDGISQAVKGKLVSSVSQEDVSLLHIMKERWK